MPDEPAQSLYSLARQRLRWEEWEALIRTNGIELDRAAGSVHPIHPEIIYPIDYGFIRETLGTDGDQLDIFVGSADTGLLAAIFTTDHRRGDTECKLIYDATPAEIYLVNGFINFDRALMEGVLVMRYPMRVVWTMQQQGER